MDMFDKVSPKSACEYDMVYAYDDKKVGRCFPEPDKDGYYPSWNEVLSSIGFSVEKDDFFHVHAENPTNGVILTFGNYAEDRNEKCFRVTGETVGYV